MSKIQGKVRKTFRMKKEQLTKWLVALRSGKYKQCDSLLHNEVTGGYCCLGVLQVVTDGDIERFPLGGHPRHLPTEKWMKDNGIKNIEFNLSDNIYTYASDFREKATSSTLSASALNDTLKLTFSEIADIMEASCEAY